MNAAQLLDDLQEKDVHFAVDGSRLRIKAPQGVLTEALRRDLEAHKPQLIELICERQPAERELLAEVAAMPLAEFALAGVIARVRSRHLGTDVLFVSDNVPESALQDLGLPIYRADELRKLALLRPGPDGLRRIHEIKTVFQGTLEDVEEAKA